MVPQQVVIIRSSVPGFKPSLLCRRVGEDPTVIPGQRRRAYLLICKRREGIYLPRARANVCVLLGMYPLAGAGAGMCVGVDMMEGMWLGW